MIVDNSAAFIQSLNWETRNLTETRDYAVVTSRAHEVAEITECFEADWAREAFAAGDHSHLIWCIGNGRQRIGQFIDKREAFAFRRERAISGPNPLRRWSAGDGLLADLEESDPNAAEDLALGT